eukprot:GFUD01069894.1.p1 GENE.GFUD01069894.1~~GFUD01069894.1.p1  ORF type:complete len:122 (-),score=29.33 GFUD01069894.1:238-603(-)
MIGSSRILSTETLLPTASLHSTTADPKLSPSIIAPVLLPNRDAGVHGAPLLLTPQSQGTPACLARSACHLASLSGSPAPPILAGSSYHAAATVVHHLQAGRQSPECRYLPGPGHTHCLHDS